MLEPDLQQLDANTGFKQGEAVSLLSDDDDGIYMQQLRGVTNLRGCLAERRTSNRMQT